MDFFDGFNVEWAEDGQAFDWAPEQYKQGWAVIGDSKPSVEQFNGVHQIADQKANWLFRQLSHTADQRNVSVSKNDEDVLTRILSRQLEALYPVGSIYINAVRDTNPGNFLPGTWEKITSGFLYPHGAEGAGPIGSTGGAARHKLTIAEMPKHSHTASLSNDGGHKHTGSTSQSGGHQHRYRDDYRLQVKSSWGGNTLGQKEDLNQSYRGTYQDDNNNNSLWYQMRDTETAGTHSHNLTTNEAGAHTHSATIGDAGEDGSHNNMPPYLTVFMFRRTS